MSLKDKMLFSFNPIKVMLEEAKVRKEEEDKLVLEIYVDSELYKMIEENLSVLREDFEAKVYLKDKKADVIIWVRDRVTVTRGGASSHGESPSVKVIGPADITKTAGNIDILIPPFIKTGERYSQNQKVPGYISGVAEIDKKYAGKFKGKNADRINLALRFVNENQKYLNLIYKSSDNVYNQYNLFEEMINNCSYIDYFTCNNNELSERIRQKSNKVWEHALSRIKGIINE